MQESNPQPSLKSVSHYDYMNTTILTIIGLVLLGQAIGRDWNDWQGVLFGIAVGAYLMTLKNRKKQD